MQGSCEGTCSPDVRAGSVAGESVVPASAILVGWAMPPLTRGFFSTGVLTGLLRTTGLGAGGFCSAAAGTVTGEVDFGAAASIFSISWAHSSQTS